MPTCDIECHVELNEEGNFTVLDHDVETETIAAQLGVAAAICGEQR